MGAYRIIDKSLAQLFMPKRNEDSNKGSCGKVLNFGGCKEYIGAAYLSSISPLKVGAGLVELASPDCVKHAISVMCPDIIYSDTKCKSYLDKIPKKLNISSYSAISIGCGLGTNKYTKRFLKDLINVLQKTNVPIVYDADALNIIAELQITQLGTNTILTPHPGEMARLMQVSIEEIQSNRELYVQKAAKKFNSTVILKGHNTLIATPNNELYRDITGTSALAKAGMGDVLTGIVTGLCAQGLNPAQAAVLGVYIHSISGVIGEKTHSRFGLLASDMINILPAGINSILL